MTWNLVVFLVLAYFAIVLVRSIVRASRATTTLSRGAADFQIGSSPAEHTPATSDGDGFLSRLFSRDGDRWVGDGGDGGCRD